MNQPRDLGKAFARAQQAQNFDLALRQFRKSVFCKSRPGKCDALSDRGRQKYPTLAHLANGFDQIAWVAGFGNIALRARFDGARRKYRIVVHAEHDDAGRSIARQNSPGQLKARNPRQTDVENADVGPFGGENRLTAFGVRRFQNRNIRVASQQRTTTRGNDRMIVNDQDTHRHRSEGLTANTRKSVCSAIRMAQTNTRHWTRRSSAAFIPCLLHLRTMPFEKKCGTVQLDSCCFLAVNALRLATEAAAGWSMAMWQKLSLRARLNTLLALVMVLGLVINIARLLLEAAPRVTAEDQSVVRLARGFVETLVSDLNDSSDPEARLDQIVEGLKQLRHVSITREHNPAAGNAPATSAPPSGSGEPRQVPEWFLTLIHPEQTTVAVPIAVNGRSLGSLVITSHPTDEIAEIWDGIVTQIEVGSAIAAALLLVTMTVVNRALEPIKSLADAMSSIEAGIYDTRVRPSGSPELAAICGKLNHLASVLGTIVEDKRHLAERVVSMQDAERKEIARDLHDEFGPYLFALRAHAASLTRLAGGPEPDLGALRKHIGTMADQVNALKQSNRRVLERLRPVGLAELGLADALAALIRLWREANPDVVIETSISPSLGERGEAAELTIYRVIQEALTNVFRHSRATRVDISVEPAVPRRTGAGETEAIMVSVRDNGAGLPADHKQGFGMLGMRERLLALGGSMSVASTSHGVTVEALVPCGMQQSRALQTT